MSAIKQNAGGVEPWAVRLPHDERRNGGPFDAVQAHGSVRTALGPLRRVAAAVVASRRRGPRRRPRSPARRRLPRQVRWPAGDARVHVAPVHAQHRRRVLRLRVPAARRAARGRGADGHGRLHPHVVRLPLRIYRARGITAAKHPIWLHTSTTTTQRFTPPRSRRPGARAARASARATRGSPPSRRRASSRGGSGRWRTSCGSSRA